MTKITSNGAGHVNPLSLASYSDVLHFLTYSGKSARRIASPKLKPPFFSHIVGLENLFLSLSTVAPAIPGTSEEEWNPLSQRPHGPLVPIVQPSELGSEITALKEAIDGFTTLSHEMMHVALWEPFFTGYWKPRSQRAFREFSLMAEGYCFFFGDIIITDAVRMRLPDGEFALERRTPSSANFHPVRAFHALSIRDLDTILNIYLEGFSGRPTKLLQPRGTNNFVAALAAQVYDFYANSQQYLADVYTAMQQFGGLSEFYRRFCSIPGLPTFLVEDHAGMAGDKDLKPYFTKFFQTALRSLHSSTSPQVMRLRWRRMLQTRAYYALQVRYLLDAGLVTGRSLKAVKRQQLSKQVEAYLDGLQALLRKLAKQPQTSPEQELDGLDRAYEQQVRAYFIEHDTWVGARWLIAPRRAGGYISVQGHESTSGSEREAKIKSLQIVAFLVDELTRRVRRSTTIEARVALLDQIARIAAFGSARGDTMRKLGAELAKPEVLKIWSLPMASFDPLANQYRELVFSYQ